MLEQLQAARRRFHPRPLARAGHRAAHRRRFAAHHGGDRHRDRRLCAPALGAAGRAVLPEGRRPHRAAFAGRLRGARAAGGAGRAHHAAGAVDARQARRVAGRAAAACASAASSACASRARSSRSTIPHLVPAGAKELAVDLVIDRLVAAPDQRSRLADSLELAFREGQDRAVVLAQKTPEAPWREIALSQSLSCAICGEVYDRLTPRHFSFNHQEGACPACGGLGPPDDLQRGAGRARSGQNPCARARSSRGASAEKISSSSTTPCSSSWPSSCPSIRKNPGANCPRTCGRRCCTGRGSGCSASGCGA